MRGLMLIALIAISTDAINNSGAITQAVWTQASTQVMAQITQINERVQETQAKAPRGGIVRN